MTYHGARVTYRGARVTYHGARVLPLGELVEYSQQIDTREEIAPTVRLTLPGLLSTTTVNVTDTATHRNDTRTPTMTHKLTI